MSENKQTQNKMLATDDKVVQTTMAQWKNKPVDTIRAEEKRLIRIMQDVRDKSDEGKSLMDVSELDGNNEAEKANHFIRIHSILSGLADARDYASRSEATIKHYLDAGTTEGDEKNQETIDNIQAMLEAAGAIQPHMPHLDEFSLYDALAEQVGFPLHGRATEYRTRSGNSGIRLTESEKAVSAVFKTSAGFPPDIRRQPGIVLDQQRPVQVVDNIPQVNVNQNSVEYAEETTFTNAAAPKDEGADLAESTFAITNKTVEIEDIGTFISATLNQLDDEGQARLYLDQRLPFAVRQKLDEQVISGNGTSPNLSGFLGNSSVTNRTLNDNAKPIDDFLAAKVIDVEKTGRGMASMAVVFHDAWVGMATSKGADSYYLGNPGIEFTPRIWSMPVVLCDHGFAFTGENDVLGLVGDFLRYCYLAVRRDMTVQIGWRNDDLTKRQITLVAWMRAALVITRPGAFVKIKRKADSG